MKLVCKEEALDENGDKVMNFTKGVIYEATEIDKEGDCYIVDDNGEMETFFNINIMFTEVK